MTPSRERMSIAEFVSLVALLTSLAVEFSSGKRIIFEVDTQIVG